MSKRRIVLVMLIVMPFVAQRAYCQKKDAIGTYEIFYQLRDLAINILKGKPPENVKSSIAPGALVADGIQFAKIHDVLDGEAKECKLVEGKGMTVQSEKFIMAEDTAAVLLFLRTDSPAGGQRIHSIVFFREPRSGWKIEGWHVSK